MVVSEEERNGEAAVVKRLSQRIRTAFVLHVAAEIGTAERRVGFSLAETERGRTLDPP